MVVSYTCEACNKTFDQKCRYVEHMNRKKPCTSVSNALTCSDCNKVFAFRSGLSVHRKTCPKRREALRLKALEDDVADLRLEQQSRGSNSVNVRATVGRPRGRAIPPRESAENAETRRALSEANAKIEELQALLSGSLKSVFGADFTGQGVYFGIAGPLLKQVGQADTVFVYPIVKFGFTLRPHERPREHEFKFGGFEVLDCVRTNFPAEVEKALKTMLGNRMFKGDTCINSRKEKELFRPTSQADYTAIVEATASLAEKVRRSHMETREFEEMRLRAAEAETRAAEARSEMLRLQIQLANVNIDVATPTPFQRS